MTHSRVPRYQLSEPSVSAATCVLGPAARTTIFPSCPSDPELREKNENLHLFRELLIEGLNYRNPVMIGRTTSRKEWPRMGRHCPTVWYYYVPKYNSRTIIFPSGNIVKRGHAYREICWSSLRKNRKAPLALKVGTIPQNMPPDISYKGEAQGE